MLLRLIGRVDRKARKQCKERSDSSELERVYNWITEQTPYGRPYQYVNGFLSQVLKPEGIQSYLVDIISTEGIITAQRVSAPMCNLPERSGLIGLASWTGDESDGDLWCIDLADDRIRCIPVGAGDDNLDEVRLASYGVLPSFRYWVSYLESRAREAKWIYW